jgi:uncharacterized protein YndB with AHSA1/START domain
MTVTAVNKDTENLTMTLTAEFEASPARVWELWENPRQLERWWGPPAYPATFTAHDLTPGGVMEYHMTGPDGDQPKAYWEIISIDPPKSLTFSDGFRNEDGSRNEDFPEMQVAVHLDEIGRGRTQMSIETRFATADAMEQLLAMGMEEGLTLAVGQIDGILAEDSMSSNTKEIT